MKKFILDIVKWFFNIDKDRYEICISLSALVYLDQNNELLHRRMFPTYWKWLRYKKGDIIKHKGIEWRK